MSSIQNAIWTLTLSASRRILLINKDRNVTAPRLDAINKYKQELGGDAMRRLPDRQQSACAKGQLHKALDPPGDRRATKRASARHTLHFPAHVRRRGIP